MTDLNNLAAKIGDTNYRNGWHDRFHTLTGRGDIEGLREHVMTKMMLTVTELAEAAEEIRNGRPLHEVYEVDGKPEGFGVEIADTIIRLLDLANMLNLNIANLVDRKVAFNATRTKMHGGKTI